MLKIRLARVGKKKKPLYRVVVSENTKDMYGDHLENLGQYNPHSKEIVLKTNRIEYWLSKGAQASATVHNLLIKEGVIKDGRKVKVVTISKKRQAKQEKAGQEVKPTTPTEEPKSEEIREEIQKEVKEESKVEIVKEEPKTEDIKTEEDKK